MECREQRRAKRFTLATTTVTKGIQVRGREWTRIRDVDRVYCVIYLVFCRVDENHPVVGIVSLTGSYCEQRRYRN